MIEARAGAVDVATGAPPADAVAEGLSQIRRADPVRSGALLEGVRTAFEMIVVPLRAQIRRRYGLVERRGFRQFETAVDERVAAKETLETRILRLEKIGYRRSRAIGAQRAGDGKIGLAAKSM